MRADFLRRLVEWATADGDFDYEEFSGESDVSSWVGAAMTAPLFSPRRTVVVRNLLRAGPPDEAIGTNRHALENLPETSLLVLYVDDEPGEDDRQKRLDAIRKRWTMEIAKIGGSVHAFDIDGKVLKEKVKEKLRELNKKMPEPAINKLIEMTGESYSKCLEEIEKLVLFAADDPLIRESDVEKLVVASREYKVYNMMNAIFTNRPGEAIRQLRVIVETPSKFTDMAFRVMFPTIRKEVRLLWQARALFESRISPGNIPDDLLSRFPKVNRIDGEKEWKAGNLMQSARKLSFPQLAEILQSLDEADEQLKGGDMGVDAHDSLERMVIRMCRAVGQQRTVAVQ